MHSRLFVVGAAVLSMQLPPCITRAAETSAAPLTLEQAIAMTLSASPALRSAAHSVAIAEGARVQAGLLPNPELSVLREGIARTNRTETVQLSQALELGGKRGARIRLADEDRSLAQGEVDTARAELRAEVTAAYFETLTAQEHVVLARESLGLAAKASNAAGRRVAAGKISPLEQTRSSVAEAGARLALAQATSDATLARRRLAAFWGSTEPESRPLLTPAGDPATIPALADLVTRLQASPQMQRARMRIAREEADANLARANRMPDLTLTVGNKKDHQAHVSQTVVGLSIPLPLFDRNQGKLLSALRRVDKARADAEVEYLKANQALADAHERASVAQELLESMRKEILPAAQNAFNAAVTGFELGKFSFTDVLDAQRTLFQSRAQYLAALSARDRSLAELARYTPADWNTK